MRADHTVETDVLVIGGGIAGAFAAIRAHERGADVALVDKAFFGRGGSSALASGVYAAYMPGDDIEAWVGESATAPQVNQRLARKAILRTYDNLMEMDRWGVKFVKENGAIARRMSGGRGAPFATNAMLAEGGPQMMIALRAHALKIGVQVVNRVMITDLLTSDGQHPTKGAVVGAVGLHTRSGESWVFKSRATVVSAGAFGFPYAPAGKQFRGQPINTSGDGVAIMYRAGATIGKFEFGGGGLRPAEFFCAPGLEMLGGLGCKFVTEEGEDILSLDRKSGKYLHEDATRGRRSALASAVLKETEAGHRVFLDATHFTEDEHRLVKQVVPIVVNTFERGGYDLRKDVVPYATTFAVSSGTSGGGARINERGETSVHGLYAAGNCSDGAYIRMGQALPGCSVLGSWAGENAAEHVRGGVNAPTDDEQVEELIQGALAPLHVADGATFDAIHGTLERLYVDVIGVVLKGENLEKAIAVTRALRAEEVQRLGAGDPRELAKVNGLKNFLELLEPALTMLLRRTESRGNILRADYPMIDNIDWANGTVCRKVDDGSTRYWEEPIPEDDDHAPIQRTRTRHPYFLSAE